MTPPIGSKTSPWLIVVAVIAALQFIAQGTALSDVVPPEVVALVALILAGIQLAVTIILRGDVTLWADVAAKVNVNGDIVAGPAAIQPTGDIVTVSGGDRMWQHPTPSGPPSPPPAPPGYPVG